MSRKTERKIKRLRKMSLVPQIIETFVVELAFLIIVGLVAFTEATSYLQNVVTKNTGTCRQIVASVEKGWDSSKKQLSGDTEEYLKNILSYSRAPHRGKPGVCLIPIACLRRSLPHVCTIEGLPVCEMRFYLTVDTPRL